MRGDDEALVVEPCRTARVGRQPDRGVDVEVVRLAGPVRVVVHLELRELHASGEQRAALRPRVGLFRRAFGLCRRVRQRKDHGPLVEPSHRLDDVLCEGAALGRHADQDGRLDVLDHVEQAIRRPVGVRPRLLRVGEVGARCLDEAVHIEEPDALACLFGRQALGLQFRRDQLRNADAGRARAEEQDALVGEAAAGLVHRGGDTGEHDRRGALDIVVVAEDAVAIALKHADRVGALPILEVDAAVREDFLHGLDALCGQRVELGFRQRLLARAHVERIGAQLLVRGADVEEHRQQARRRDGCACGVELQLADRDAHPVRADVAESENPAAGRHADEAHIALRPVAQHVGDPAFHIAGNVHPARAVIQVAELQAGIRYGRIVADRDEAPRVRHDRPVEHRLVARFEINQVDVAREIVAEPVEVRQHAFDLAVERLDRVRQQPFQPEPATLLAREGRPFVERRVVQQRGAGQRRDGMGNGRLLVFDSVAGNHVCKSSGCLTRGSTQAPLGSRILYGKGCAICARCSKSLF